MVNKASVIILNHRKQGSILYRDNKGKGLGNLCSDNLQGGFIYPILPTYFHLIVLFLSKNQSIEKIDCTQLIGVLLFISFLWRGMIYYTPTYMVFTCLTDFFFIPTASNKILFNDKWLSNF